MEPLYDETQPEDLSLLQIALEQSTPPLNSEPSKFTPIILQSNFCEKTLN